jgi:hypothetical protein
MFSRVFDRAVDLGFELGTDSAPALPRTEQYHACAVWLLTFLVL